MIVIVSYDIIEDRRRRQIRELLKNHGEPVQYSVFECNLKASELVEIQKKASGLMKERKDSILYLPLCENCVKKISGLKKEHSHLPRPGLIV